jgi:cytochrome b subunit of formate dehydrogenase
MAVQDSRMVLAVALVLAFLLAAGWLVIAQAHLYFGVLWVPLALVASRKGARS